MVLKTMTSFIFEQNEKIKTPRDGHIGCGQLYYIMNVSRYAKFLAQPLNLSMFIPCDEHEQPLIDPEYLDCDGITYYSKLNEYECAKYNIIFKGFEYLGDGHVRSFMHIVDVDEIDSIEELAIRYSNEIEFTSRAIYNLFR